MHRFIYIITDYEKSEQKKIDNVYKSVYATNMQ